jgi:hypothetical protein
MLYNINQFNIRLNLDLHAKSSLSPIKNKKIWNFLLPNVYVSLKNEHLENIRKYYNMQYINSNNRINKYLINLEKIDLKVLKKN